MTASRRSDPVWTPPPLYPDDAPTEPNTHRLVIIVVTCCIAFAALVTLAIVHDIKHPEDSYSYRCTHKGGVVVDDHCINKKDVINP